MGQPERAGDAMRACPRETEDEIRENAEEEAGIRRALDLLDDSRADSYAAALIALNEGLRSEWAELLARDPGEAGTDEAPRTPDALGLRAFLEGEVLAWFETRGKELANRSLIRAQAFGESLDPDKLERLGRYEVHLDRKFERTLSMLLRFQDLRRVPVAE